MHTLTTNMLFTDFSKLLKNTIQIEVAVEIVKQASCGKQIKACLL